MATIPQLTENFSAGPNGATVVDASIFTSANATGTGTSIFSSADAIEGSFACEFPNNAGLFALRRVDLPAAGLVYLQYYGRIKADTSTNTAITLVYSGATKLGDVRITPGRLFQLRNNNSAVYTHSVAPAIGAVYRLDTLWDPNSGSGTLQSWLYTGANVNSTNTADAQTSGPQTLTAAVTTVDNIRFGLASSDATLAWAIDRIRADDATFPAPIVTNVPPTANAGPDQVDIEPYATVTLDGTGSTDSDGTVTGYAWTQTAGTTVSITGASTANPTFTAPPTIPGDTLTFQLIVTDNQGANSTADTVNITVLPHNRWDVAADGTTQVPVRRERVN